MSSDSDNMRAAGTESEPSARCGILARQSAAPPPAAHSAAQRGLAVRRRGGPAKGFFLLEHDHGIEHARENVAELDTWIHDPTWQLDPIPFLPCSTWSSDAVPKRDA